MNVFSELSNDELRVEIMSLVDDALEMSESDYEDLEKYLTMVMKTNRMRTGAMTMNAFEALEVISTAWADKQIYFMEEDGFVYSRRSRRTMSIDDAIEEFADVLSPSVIV